MAKGSKQATAEAEAQEQAPAPSFEGALDRLEGTVDRLEAGELPLEEALELFESGVKLARQCAETLDAAERRIEILVEGREDDRSEPFDAVTGEEGDEEGDEEDEAFDE